MTEGKSAEEVIKREQGERKEGEDDFSSAMQIPWFRLIPTRGLYLELSWVQFAQGTSICAGKQALGTVGTTCYV